MLFRSAPLDHGLITDVGVTLDPAAAVPTSGNGTIYGPVYHTVRLDAGRYGNALTVATGGIIEPRGYGAPGVRAGADAAGATVLNLGTIGGGNGRNGTDGGVGVMIVASNATLTNDGLISGGASDGRGQQGPSDGGIGVDLTGAAALLVNNGTIRGGYSSDYLSSGGTGLNIAGRGSNVTNYGTIVGGGCSNIGGAGVDVTSAATLTNRGTISSGATEFGKGANAVNVEAAGSTILNYGVVSGVGYSEAGINIMAPATIVNDGTIIGGYAGPAVILAAAGVLTNNGELRGGGDAVIISSAGVTLTNDGQIRGGLYEFGYHKAGVLATAYTNLTNAGTIAGGTGTYGAQGSNYGTAGGFGIHLMAGGNVSNTGVISGGQGAYGSYYVACGGGVGIQFDTAGTLTNSGMILGGNAEGGNYGKHSIGAPGGNGVIFLAGGTLINTGTIDGGRTSGGGRGGRPSSDGDGVWMNGGTLVNYGTIADPYSTGDSSYAAVLTGGATLVVEPGAVFDGLVAANSSDLLEFGGSSPGTLSGIGSLLTGFGTISELGGATWSLTGTNVVGKGINFLDSGSLSFLGTLTNTGTITVAGGTLGLLGTTVNNGLIEVVSGTATAGIGVEGSGQLAVGASASLLLENGALAGQTINFLSASGFVDLNHPLSFFGEIEGFGGSDQIDLTKPTGFAETGYSYSDGVLTIVDKGATVAKLIFLGNYTTASFSLSSDGHNGILVTFK